ncbi:hypothetical protein DDZ14_14160 [Maritimibacter sp. 55A14]|uniref:hypothetical protein n=1 Tax=Maritimibacter sp. 55A14 TaxID=2174844 RepID=UPI000D60FC03|nr:hypothetical protein [Maritimibacter sp. 55A14]PWE31161.1 hypothetical protein DDZ14_14160 [Maritimibacter sp. 55A14]
MKNTPTYERPNTVSGLKAKRKELSDLRARYKAEIKKLTVDIDHLDAAIRLFDPAADSYAIKEYVTKHRAEKGSVKRFVLNAFREADGPLTSRQITEAWVDDRGLAADEATYALLRKRIGACIKGCVNQGLIKDVGWTKDHDQNGPYKMWTLNEGAAP